MKIAIGIQTCERPEFLKRCVNTLVRHNPIVQTWPIYIADDASKSFDVHEYLESIDDLLTGWFIHENRMGISVTLKRMIDTILEYSIVDVLLYIQADWYCNRTIDFDAIIKFFMNYPEVGQLRTIRNKGVCGKPLTRAAGVKNAITKRMVEEDWREVYGSENITLGSWCYADLPSFITTPALEILYKDFNDAHHREYYRMLNMHNAGFSVAMLENQPFWNQDPRAAKRTPGGKR
jgi:hypothetical protein